MPDHYQFMESERGVSRLPPAAVAEALYDVLLTGTEYLLSLAGDSDRAKKLHRKVANLRSAAKQQEQRLMWLTGLGVDEGSVRAGWRRLKRYLQEFSPEQQAALLKATESALVIEGSCQAALMFGSAAPNVTRRDALTLAHHVVELYDPTGDPDTIRPIVRAEPLDRSAAPSWFQGYALAEEMLERVAGPFVGDQSVDINGVLESLQIQVRELRLRDQSIRGVSVAGPQHKPGMLVNITHPANHYPSGCRFTLAHELCHILFDRAAGCRLAVASGPWAPRDIERRANAFAAMLLMPVTLVSQAVVALTEPLETLKSVAEVAKSLRTSVRAALWHLGNLGFIEDAIHQQILIEATRAEED